MNYADFFTNVRELCTRINRPPEDLCFNPFALMSDMYYRENFHWDAVYGDCFWLNFQTEFQNCSTAAFWIIQWRFVANLLEGIHTAKTALAAQTDLFVSQDNK